MRALLPMLVLLLLPAMVPAQTTAPAQPAQPAAPRAAQPPAQPRPQGQPAPQAAPRPRPAPPAAAPQAAPAPPPPPPPPPPPHPPVRENPVRGPVTGLPLPRFAATRSDEINLRAGPGMRYHVEWVLTRKDMPVEIIREHDVWRRVRDSEGTEGWVQTGTLSGRRVFVVVRSPATLRRRAAEDSEPVARLAVGVMGRIRGCADKADWCEVQASGHRGFLPRSAFWGVYKDEPIN